MTAHMNDDQLARWLAGDRDAPVDEHLTQCESCRASVDRLGKYIDEYRQALFSGSERGESFWAKQAAAIHRRMATRRSIAIPRWAYAATALLLVFAVLLMT